ncbi:MAG: CoA pyrophosphatase [Comamonas sp.]
MSDAVVPPVFPPAPSRAADAPGAPLGPVVRPPPFDPRQVPQVSRPGVLPAVDAARLTPEALRQRFAVPPHWQPERVAEPRLLARDPVAAAVLVPLVRRQELHVLLTERSAQLTHHSGQIAFPGGRVDPGDADAVAAALREAWEEVGLSAGHVEVLGTLPTYLTGTAYGVTPVVALVDAEAAWRPNPDEVADVFEVPLAYLMNPAHHRWHRLEWDEQGARQSREWLSIPYWDVGAGRERFIWGATAGMLRNFYRLLAAG